MWALFGRNVCENERIGSRWGKGVGAARTPWIRQCTEASVPRNKALVGLITEFTSRLET